MLPATSSFPRAGGLLPNVTTTSSLCRAIQSSRRMLSTSSKYSRNHSDIPTSVFSWAPARSDADRLSLRDLPDRGQRRLDRLQVVALHALCVGGLVGRAGDDALEHEGKREAERELTAG